MPCYMLHFVGYCEVTEAIFLFHDNLLATVHLMLQQYLLSSAQGCWYGCTLHMCWTVLRVNSQDFRVLQKLTPSVTPDWPLCA